MKKRGVSSAGEFRRKLFIPEHEIYESIEHKVKSKIGKIFVNEEILLLKFMKLILILVKIMKKIEVDNNGKKYILFRINVYFTKYCFAVQIDEKGHTDRDLISEQKIQEELEKKLNCKCIRINTSKENFDIDYKAGKIQTFISQFKDNKIKEIDNKNKELEDEIKKLKLQLANLSVKNNDINDKK